MVGPASELAWRGVACLHWTPCRDERCFFSDCKNLMTFDSISWLGNCTWVGFSETPQGEQIFPSAKVVAISYFWLHHSFVPMRPMDYLDHLSLRTGKGGGHRRYGGIASALQLMTFDISLSRLTLYCISLYICFASVLYVSSQ